MAACRFLLALIVCVLQLPCYLPHCTAGVRALTLDGDLTLSELAGSTKEGSLLYVGPGGSGRVTAGSLKWVNETLEVPRLTGHHVSGDVDMEGHVLKGVRLDVSAGGSIEGLQDLRVQVHIQDV
jgi:hypothetical protein